MSITLWSPDAFWRRPARIIFAPTYFCPTLALTILTIFDDFPMGKNMLDDL